MSSVIVDVTVIVDGRAVGTFKRIRAFANWEGCEGSGLWLYLGGVFKMFLMVALQTY